MEIMSECLLTGMTAPIPKGGNREPSFHQQSEPHSILIVYTEEEGGTIEFKEKVARFIIFLRKHWPYVVASCDFEDFIIEKTGWNWTEEKPLQPPMIDGKSV